MKTKKWNWRSHTLKKKDDDITKHAKMNRRTGGEKEQKEMGKN